jgi:triosephosphate isomerase
MAIPRNLQPSFDWTCDETDAHLSVTFSFPPTFDLRAVRSRLHKVDSKSCIPVTFSEVPYLLHGILTGDAQSAELESRESDHSRSGHSEIRTRAVEAPRQVACARIDRD